MHICPLHLNNLCERDIMPTSPTDAEMLTSINIAIKSKTDGISEGEVKELSIRDKRFIEYPLTELLDLRKYFKNQASAVAVNGIKKVVIRNVGHH